MISQKIVQQELGRKGGVRFAINNSDSPRGKIARREVQALDRINRPLIPVIKKLTEAVKQMDKFEKKYRNDFMGGSECNYKKLIDELENYLGDIFDGQMEEGFDDSGWFSDL